jgi:hypothetical protein
MWNDFVEAFGDRFEKKEMFAKTSLFVSELKTWVEWHDCAAQQSVQRTAIACSVLGAFAGWVICRLVFGG